MPSNNSVFRSVSLHPHLIQQKHRTGRKAEELANKKVTMMTLMLFLGLTNKIDAAFLQNLLKKIRSPTENSGY